MIHLRKIIVARILIVFVATLAVSSAFAEDDGEEFLLFMRSSSRAQTAQPFVDDVVARWNETAFCLPPQNRKQLSFDAVKLYLESNPNELYRPRRYLIIQGLRASYPCPAK